LIELNVSLKITQRTKRATQNEREWDTVKRKINE
jgi:hypothetical protein